MPEQPLLPEFNEAILAPEADDIVCPVYTQPLHEFRLHEYCQRHEVISYLPVKKSWKVHNYSSKGRRYNYSRMVLRPMFSSYVFVRMKREQQSLLYASRSVLHFLPVVHQDRLLRDIRIVRQLEAVGLEQELEFNAGLAEGDRFIIESGAWEGVTGWLKRKDSKYKWTVEIDFINEFVSAEIDPSQYQMTRLD